MSSMSAFIALLVVVVVVFLALKLLVLVLRGLLGFFGLRNPTMHMNSSFSFSNDHFSDDLRSDNPEAETYLGMDWEEYQRMFDLERL